jgi:hypothetical protein
MAKQNWKQIYARKRDDQKRILKICPDCPETSGIYCFHRVDEDGFKFAYIGQATTNLLKRSAEHLSTYQGIDNSIRKHGLYDAEKNPYGYKVSVMCVCAPEECDEQEQIYIKKAADAGYQLRNQTAGSQGVGKKSFGTQKAGKGYHDGLAQGEKNARKFVADLFAKHLTFSPKPKSGKFPTENQIKAMQKFEEFLKMEEVESVGEKIDS